MKLLNRVGVKTRIILFSVLVGIAALFAMSLFYKERAAKYAINSYLSARGIKAEFNVTHFSLSDITLTDLIIEDKIKIPRIHLLLKKGLGIPTALDANIENIDIEALQKIINKLNPPNNKSKTDFTSLKTTCDSFYSIALNLETQSLTWKDITIPLALRLQHADTSQPIQLTFQGEAQNPQISHGGEIQILCQPDGLKLTVSKLHASLNKLGDINDAQISFLPSEISLLPTNRIAFDLSAQGLFHGTYKGQNIDLSFKHFKVSNSAPLEDLLTGDVLASAHDLKVTSPKKISFKDLGVFPFKKGSDIFIKYEFRDMDFKNDKDEPIVHQIDSEGECSILPSLYQCQSVAHDPTKTLFLKSLLLSYSPATSVITVDLSKNKNTLRINDDITKSLPILSQWIKSGKGQVKLAGRLSSTPKGWQGDMGLQTQAEELKTEFGNLNGLNLKHNLLNYPDFSSSPQRQVHITQYSAGFNLENIEAQYQIINSSEIKVDHLKLNYEGGLIEAKDFTIFPKEKHVKNFSATIKKYPLKKLLSLGLKDQVSATGTLSGTINITFHGKVPIMSGKLNSDAPGAIQYRTGQLQKSQISLSDSPMDILYGYLYDFEYKTLSVDIKTNDKYKMDMLLSAYGHNPGYLNGKPLKLNVNMEQNLLAAIRSMMLTYDLPNKIKEHLEKADQE